MHNVGGTFTSLLPAANNEFLAAGRPNGYSIYSLAPLQEICRRTLPGENGARLVAISATLPVVSIVAGNTKILKKQVNEKRTNSTKITNMKHADTPEMMAPNEVFIMNDSSGEILNRLKYSACVLGMRIDNGFLFVRTEAKMYIHSFTDFRILATISLPKHAVPSDNASPVVQAMAVSADYIVAAYPSSAVGSVIIFTLRRSKGAYLFKTTETVIAAHRTPVACFALSPNGKYLATVSTHGTKIRLYDTDTGMEIGDLRRGTTPAIITSMTFDTSSTRLVSCSRNGTIHIFALDAFVSHGHKSKGRNKAANSEISGKPKEIRSCAIYRFAEKIEKMGAYAVISGSTVLVILETGNIHDVVFSVTAGCTLNRVWTIE